MGVVHLNQARKAAPSTCRYSIVTPREVFMSSAVVSSIRDVLREHAGLATDVDTLSDNESLFDAGLSSMSTVNVMLALEDAFDVEFPESLLSRKTFESVESIVEAVSSLVGA